MLNQPVVSVHAKYLIVKENIWHCEESEYFCFMDINGAQE